MRRWQYSFNLLFQCLDVDSLEAAYWNAKNQARWGESMLHSWSQCRHIGLLASSMLDIDNFLQQVLTMYLTHRGTTGWLNQACWVVIQSVPGALAFFSRWLWKAVWILSVQYAVHLDLGTHWIRPVEAEKLSVFLDGSRRTWVLPLD